MSNFQALVLPLSQRPGALLRPLVKPGDQVTAAQPVAVAEPVVGGLVDPTGGQVPAATLHSPLAGTVTDCREHEVLLGGQLVQVPCLIVEPTFAPGESLKDHVQLVTAAPSAARSHIMARIVAALPNALDNLASPSARHKAMDAIAHDSGIIGLGGGGFPLHAKLTASVCRIVINAAECEPYADADNALMLTAPGEVIAGCFLVCALLGLNELTFAIKRSLSAARDLLETVEAQLRRLLGSERQLPRITLLNIPAHYPAGAEQQVVKQAFGIEIPAGERASQAGVACINVSTLAALGRFLLWQEPLSHRIVTVAGAAVARPGNYRVPVGLPAAQLLEAAGLMEARLAGLVHGGGMMGVPLQNTWLPLGKSSYCLVAAGSNDTGLAVEHAVRQRSGRPLDASPCIRCGFCEPVCPVGLLPQQLHFAAVAEDSDWLQAYHLSACIECGACEAVCPSKLPLVAEYRTAKLNEHSNQLARQKASHARLRFEQRTERLRVEALERDAKRAARKAAAGIRRPKP
ncbi:RnfABCDGE type electron transport complex subunit C [Allohahella sp. A8]|uniref:RnfABCDGE type electron transport complex subunit C n=1 Tax=Allohahella sp. A8 TaxID=3141461 RepID=UPI000C09B6F2|nr:hypothetical protein [Hahellaceae bacterium]|tara:strand:+ start:83564 stop:85117 length:1554 start_codon:yes stop_codon:yes gene_type:complete